MIVPVLRFVGPAKRSFTLASLQAPQCLLLLMALELRMTHEAS
jgi:hypothetical protein